MNKKIKKLKIMYHNERYNTDYGALIRDPNELYIHTECIEIDKASSTISIEQRVCDIVHKKSEYWVDHIDDFLDDIKFIDKKLTKSTYKLTDLKNIEYYQIYVKYEDGKELLLKDSFSRLHLPKNYLDIITKIENLIKNLDDDMMFLFMSKELYESELLPNEYYYIGVSFTDDGPIYYYKTKNRDMGVGDPVLVPTKKAQTIAIVESVDIYNDKNAPIPFNKVKDVIRTLDPDEFN